MLKSFIVSIVGISLAIACCNGQVNSGLPRPGTQDVRSDSSLQIGQYVREVFEDRAGNLWFGTLARGVCRFDGKSLKYFTKDQGLAGNQINGITEDARGNLWFATTQGVSRYDGESFTNFTTKDGLIVNSCWSILADSRGNIWVGTEFGVHRYDGSTFSDFPLPKAKVNGPPSVRFSTDLAWCIVEDSQGNIWFGTDGVGVCKYDWSSFSHFTSDDGLCNNNVRYILEDSKGNLWFGSWGAGDQEGGLSRFDGSSFSTFPEQQGLINSNVGPIQEDRAGNIWIASMKHGAYRFDGENFKMFQQTDRYDLARNFCVQCILEDKDGTQWFGFSGGLFRFDGETFVNVTQDGPWHGLPEPRPERVRILEAPDDWRIEQMRFPIPFAPSIDFHGLEELRFAPGWSRPDSPEFWTYKFVWEIDEAPQLTEGRLSSLAETYFDGLSPAVSRGGEPFQKPVAVFVRNDKGFCGRLRIFDAFGSGEWITLNVRVNSVRRGDKHLVIFELSPQKFDHEVWARLDQVRVREPAIAVPATGK